MIKNSVNLSVGGLNCCLVTPSDAWRNFLREQYQGFLLKKGITDFQAIFKISPLKSQKRFQFKIASSDSAYLYCPDDMGKFRRIDFFFKKFYSYVLSKNKGFLLHASAISDDRRAYIFSGKRGAGKSTIYKLLPKYKILADDAAIIRRVKNQYWAFGSPFIEKNMPDSGNINVPISGLYFLKKSDKNRLEKIGIEETVKKLIIHTCKFSEKMSRILLANLWETCYDFANKIPTYLLFFKKDASFWQIIKEKNG